MSESPGKLSAENWKVIFEQLCLKHFGITPDVFVAVLQMSPNARGYILGSLSEMLLRRQLAQLGYSALRIKEKWVGPKLHHGDLYVSRNQKDWFVVESKGLKSNSEEWHNIEKIDPSHAALEKWFDRKRSGEFRQWWKSISPGRKQRILDSGKFNKAKVLETHFVSGTAGRSGRKIATPLKSEFHMVALDLYLRTDIHDFVFASSEALPPAEGHPEHLKQNYLLDIVVPGADDAPTFSKPWTKDFNAVFRTLKNPVKESEMQPDERKAGEREAEVSGRQG
jgi:hypothetical protein